MTAMTDLRSQDHHLHQTQTQDKQVTNKKEKVLNNKQFKNTDALSFLKRASNCQSIQTTNTVTGLKELITKETYSDTKQIPSRVRKNVLTQGLKGN